MNDCSIPTAPRLFLPCHRHSLAGRLIKRQTDRQWHVHIDSPEADASSLAALPRKKKCVSAQSDCSRPKPQKAAAPLKLQTDCSHISQDFTENQLLAAAAVAVHLLFKIMHQICSEKKMSNVFHFCQI